MATGQYYQAVNCLIELLNFILILICMRLFKFHLNIYIVEFIFLVSIWKFERGRIER